MFPRSEVGRLKISFTQGLKRWLGGGSADWLERTRELGLDHTVPGSSVAKRSGCDPRPEPGRTDSLRVCVDLCPARQARFHLSDRATM